MPKPSEDVGQWRAKYLLLLDNAVNLRTTVGDLYNASCLVPEESPDLAQEFINFARESTNKALIETNSISAIKRSIDHEDGLSEISPPDSTHVNPPDPASDRPEIARQKWACSVMARKTLDISFAYMHGLFFVDAVSRHEANGIGHAIAEKIFPKNAGWANIAIFSRECSLDSIDPETDEICPVIIPENPK